MFLYWLNIVVDVNLLCTLDINVLPRCLFFLPIQYGFSLFISLLLAHYTPLSSALYNYCMPNRRGRASVRRLRSIPTRILLLRTTVTEPRVANSSSQKSWRVGNPALLFHLYGQFSIIADSSKLNEDDLISLSTEHWFNDNYRIFIYLLI